jgi:hypothetical protein
MGEEVQHDPHPEHAHQQLEQPDHQGQQHGVTDEGRATRRGERLERGRGHQGHHRHRARRQLPRRAEKRRDQRRHQGSIQPVMRRQARELRIGHGLRDEDQRDGQAGDGVRAQRFPVTEFRQPLR